MPDKNTNLLSYLTHDGRQVKRRILQYSLIATYFVVKRGLLEFHMQTQTGSFTRNGAVARVSTASDVIRAC